MLNYKKYEKDLQNLGITNAEEQREIVQALFNFAMVACDIYLNKARFSYEEKDPVF